MYFNIESLNLNIFPYLYEICWTVHDDRFEPDDGEFPFSNINPYYTGIRGVAISTRSNSKRPNISGKVSTTTSIHC